jgi:hypothetical protein
MVKRLAELDDADRWPTVFAYQAYVCPDCCQRLCWLEPFGCPAAAERPVRKPLRAWFRRGVDP